MLLRPLCAVAPGKGSIFAEKSGGVGAGRTNHGIYIGRSESDTTPGLADHLRIDVSKLCERLAQALEAQHSEIVKEGGNCASFPIHGGIVGAVELEEKRSAGTKNAKHLLNGSGDQFPGREMLQNKINEHEIQ